jgi:predicted Holliday junction resolvase-like endonuclease
MSSRKFSQEQIQTALGVLALVLVVALVVLSLVNRNLQRSVQLQQVQINNGRVTQQVATNVIKDLAQMSLRDSEISTLLKKHGFEIKQNSSSSNSSNNSNSGAAPSSATR